MTTPPYFRMTENFMIDSLKKHIGLGLDTSEVFILGKKNADYIEKLNRKAKLFGRLTVLEHPRYIQQYKSKDQRSYIDKYIFDVRTLLTHVYRAVGHCKQNL